MKCEQCLANLETGSVSQRFFARRHAQRCPQCAAAIGKFDELKRDLAACEPLTSHQRRLWERAAVQVTTQPTLERPVWQLAFARAAAVAACMLVIGFFFWSTHPRVTKPPIEVAKVDLNPELDRLNNKLDTLEAEIAQLSQKAELTDVHQQVLAMIDTYKRW